MKLETRDCIEVEHVEVLRLEPGDTLIVRTEQTLTQEQADKIKAVVLSQVPAGTPVLVVGNGITFTIARID